ncbi:MAG: potassium-transporting ATPase subunit A [Verrucomicrobia bacterium]|nr:potassium-transporting ATPase subunit A [Verrucomicrobiota bacterium]
MTQAHWLELIFILSLILLLAKPIGLYLYRVLDPKGKTGLEFALKPLEKLTYRICSIDASAEQDWKKYTISIFLFTLIGFIFTFLILSFQDLLPLNPEGIPAPSFLDRFNATISFITNTDWENYVPEQEISYFTNMFAFTTQNYCSAGIGICVAAALARGIAANSSKLLGNFWVDIIRICYYVFLPLSLVFAVFFISEGVPQNFKAFAKVCTVDGGNEQTIVQGPMASQESIKLIGSNGGGPTNADSSHPYENPTPISNFAQILAMLLIPAGQIYYFGMVVQNLKHAWSIFIFMTAFFALGVVGIGAFAEEGNTNLIPYGIDLTEGNMEGKEQRFCVFDTALFSNATTAAGNGSMNAMHSSFVPGAQVITLQNMQIGNLIFGGVGSGLYSIVRLIMVSSFIAGLIIGRAPQYLGKKIESFEIKMCMIPIIVFIIGITGLTALSFLTPWGLQGMGQKGPHGFTSILYTFSSTMVNNGTDYGGIDRDTNFFNIATAIAMMAGRYLTILATMAMAGSLATKKKHIEKAGSFPITGFTFIILISSVFFIINALGYLPSIMLGPVYEQILMIEGKLE